MLKKIFFRLNVGSIYGLGHWYRCLALVTQLKKQGYENIVVLPDLLPDQLKHALERVSIDYNDSRNWDSQYEMEILLKAYPESVLVMDTIDTEERYVKKIIKHAPVITIGGNGDGRNYVNVRIDGMIPRHGYADNFVGDHLYIGPEYIILREYFLAPPSPVLNEYIKRVVVFYGGDAKGAGVVFAEKLSQMFPELMFDVILGPVALKGNQDLSSIKIHHSLDNPRPIMEHADIAVTAGGMSTYELVRLGIPVFLVPQVPLQDITSSAFENAGVGFKISLQEQKSAPVFEKKIMEIMNKMQNLDFRKSCSKKGISLVDGKGLYRVANIIANYKDNSC